MILNRYVPHVSTKLRPSVCIRTLLISSMVPYSACGDEAPGFGAITIPKEGRGDSRHRRSMSRYLLRTWLGAYRQEGKRTYLGSKKCSAVGIPGKLSWQTKMGVSRRASRSSVSMASLRSAYDPENASRTETA